MLKARAALPPRRAHRRRLRWSSPRWPSRVAGCGSPATTCSSSAATSLRPPSPTPASTVEPGDSHFSFAGSDELAAQIARVPAGRLAAANTKLPTSSKATGNGGKPVVFARTGACGRSRGTAPRQLVDNPATPAEDRDRSPTVPVARTSAGPRPASPAQRKAILATVARASLTLRRHKRQAHQARSTPLPLQHPRRPGSDGRLPRSISLEARPVAYGVSIGKGAKTRGAQKFVDVLLTASGAAAAGHAGFGSAAFEVSRGRGSRRSCSCLAVMLAFLDAPIVAIFVLIRPRRSQSPRSGTTPLLDASCSAAPRDRAPITSSSALRPRTVSRRAASEARRSSRPRQLPARCWPPAAPAIGACWRRAGRAGVVALHRRRRASARCRRRSLSWPLDVRPRPRSSSSGAQFASRRSPTLARASRTRASEGRTCAHRYPSRPAGRHARRTCAGVGPARFGEFGATLIFDPLPLVSRPHSDRAARDLRASSARTSRRRSPRGRCSSSSSALLLRQALSASRGRRMLRVDARTQLGAFRASTRRVHGAVASESALVDRACPSGARASTRLRSPSGARCALSPLSSQPRPLRRTLTVLGAQHGPRRRSSAALLFPDPDAAIARHRPPAPATRRRARDGPELRAGLNAHPSTTSAAEQLRP